MVKVPENTRLLWTLLLLAGMAMGLDADSQSEPAKDETVFTFHIDLQSTGDDVRQGDDQLARWALDSWSRASGGKLRFVAVDEDEARIRIRFNTDRAGLFGEMVPFQLGDQTGATVYIVSDVSMLGETIRIASEKDDLFRDTIVFLTCVHELGHALGLSHTDQFDDIMYSFGFGGDILEYFSRFRRTVRSRADLQSMSPFSEADVDRLRKRHR